jgi:hypothetical protein
MASFPITLPALPTVTPPLNVGPVVAAAPVALVSADSDLLPLPFAQSLPATPSAAPAEVPQTGAAMLPDQVFMARQLVFAAPDARTLAGTWRSMVRTYGSELVNREQQARARQLPPAQLVAAQEGRVLDPRGTLGAPVDAWRFTVHPGGQHEQHLLVVADEADQPPGRRRRGRAALRLELELADGTRIVVQAEPMADGVALELCAPDARTLDRLRELQPALEDAIGRAGLRVLRWKFRDSLPAGSVHARMAAAEAANGLNLAVFRVVAEVALLLPAQE